MKKFLIKFQILSIFLGVCLALDYITERPSYLKECEIKNPEFKKCAIENFQGLFDQMAKGIPSLKSLPKIDPYKVNKVQIRQEGNSAVNLKAEFTDVLIRGLSKAVVKDVHVNQKDYSWKGKIHLAYASIESNYAMQGRILLIPMNGNGQMYCETENMDVVLEAKTKLYEKDGLTFANVTDMKVDYTISGLKIDMKNLFNGNKALEDSTNVFFNENWKSFAEVLKPVMQETMSEILLDTFYRVFKHFPAQFFVADIPTSNELYG